MQTTVTDCLYATALNAKGDADKMKKKIIRYSSLVFLFICLCQQFASASWMSITEYNQYNPSDWAKEAVCSLEYYGII